MAMLNQYMHFSMISRKVIHTVEFKKHWAIVDDAIDCLSLEEAEGKHVHVRAHTCTHTHANRTKKEEPCSNLNYPHTGIQNSVLHP